MEAGEVVLSEVHLEQPALQLGCTAATTTFTDGAGQPLVSVCHAMATPLRSVGLQVWRGALLLADLLLHRGAAAFAEATALELGAGAGLAGLVLAGLGPRSVYLTDTGEEVLANCAANARLHAEQQQQQRQQQKRQQGQHQPGECSGSGAAAVAPLLVRQLDWCEPPDFLAAAPPAGQPQLPSSSSGSDFGWQPSDVEALRQLVWLLAADCVYDDVLTEAFMRSATLLMRHAQRHSGRSPRLLVGLERRVCFTLVDQAARAPAYDYWRTLFEAVEDEAAAAAAAETEAACTGGGGPKQRPQHQQHGSPPAAQLPLVGWRIDLEQVPQALHPYQRTAELELWELVLRDDGV